MAFNREKEIHDLRVFLSDLPETSRILKKNLDSQIKVIQAESLYISVKLKEYFTRFTVASTSALLETNSEVKKEMKEIFINFGLLENK